MLDHNVPFGMCHVISMYITHDQVVCFSSCGMIFEINIQLVGQEVILNVVFYHACCDAIPQQYFNPILFPISVQV